MTCAVCLTEFETYAANPAALCSAACRSWSARNGLAAAPLAGRQCGWCAKPIVGRNRRSLYCTDRCTRTAAQARRHAKGAGNLTRHKVLALHVFDRDGWTCHLCGHPIDRDVREGPLMPSLDHLVPVSHPNYPGHVIWNLAASHLRCNYLRKAVITPGARSRFHELCRRYEVGELVAPPEGDATRVTHCKWGHAYDPDETYPGRRYCRQCNRERPWLRSA